MSLRLLDVHIKSTEVNYPILRSAPTGSCLSTFNNHNIKTGVTPAQTQSKTQIKRITYVTFAYQMHTRVYEQEKKHVERGLRKLHNENFRN
jgi:ribonuclease PH